MIACPDWLTANDDDLPVGRWHFPWQLLAFKIKKNAAVCQIKTFIKFRILFNWEWRIVSVHAGFNPIWIPNQHSDLLTIEFIGCADDRS